MVYCLGFFARKQLSSLSLSSFLCILEVKHVEGIIIIIIIQIPNKTCQGNKYQCEDQLGGAFMLRQGLKVIKLRCGEELQVEWLL